MLITVRAYRHTDLDLMLLGDALGKNYSGFIRECLRCYLRGVPLRAGIPEIPFVPSEHVTNQSKSTGVMLKEGDDTDIIAMLKNIRYGYRNNFVKNIVRMYTMMHCIAAYAENEACYAMLRLPQEAKLNNTAVLSIPEARPKSTEPKKEFVSRPKFVAEPKPVPEKSAVAQDVIVPTTVSEQSPAVMQSSPAEPITPAEPAPAYVPPADAAWGEADAVVEVREEAPVTQAGSADDEMDILDMFAGIIG